ncbi:hypothetical protein [Bifidobacterium sp.]|jgi:hypothetical protein|uniref:hypothetical protein n=1 Tax=Bifidobacterium sp. TaxID=41200 RepID=UPI0025BE688E|nr:hypothetical protein [Bifidobacterium sp.]MCI1635625.1 hypothetical protein [Bifidobacterium sp.]
MLHRLIRQSGDNAVLLSRGLLGTFSVLAAVLMMFAAVALPQSASAVGHGNSSIPVKWSWDGTYPMLRINTSAEVTKRVRVGNNIVFEDAVFWDDKSSIENDKAVTREIIEHPVQGAASLGSVHYSAVDAQPGTYPFVVRYTSIWGQQIDVTYTAIVYTESIVDDVVDAVTGGSSQSAIQARDRLASTGADLGKLLIMAAFAFTAFLICGGARHFQRRTSASNSHVLTTSL